MINIAELLKDAPKGMKLYSPLFGEIEFDEVLDTSHMPIRVMKRGYGLRFDKYGRFIIGDEYPDAECLLFPSDKVRTWEGWKLPNEPAFKVNEWIILDKTYTIPIQVIEINQKEGLYRCKSIEGLYGNYDITHIDKDYHLWTIADAKDGDVLVTTKIRSCPFIYRKTAYPNDFAYYYAGIDGNGNFCEGCLKRTLAHFGPVASVVPATKEQCDLLFAKMKEAGYKWDSNKKELCKIVETQFKVGDWVVKKDGTPFYGGNYTEQITNIEDDGGLECIWFSSGTWLCDRDIRLWSITDARDGDVLVNRINNPFIYNGNMEFSSVGAYVGVYQNGKIILDMFPSKTWTNVMGVKPATKEQRDLLFVKMQKIGYEWDADKKELKKILKHYDIKNFHAGMEVLVRDANDKEWRYVLYSHYTERFGLMRFNAGATVWNQCIPFNEDTKHLLGTTDMCDEQYINW